MAKFSEKWLRDDVKTPERRTRYRDAATPGFCLDVQPSGARSFGWHRKVRGNATYRRIDTDSVAEARRIAEGWNRLLADWKNEMYAGASPFTRQMAPASSDVPTLRALMDAYLADRVREHTEKGTPQYKIDDALYEDRNLAKNHFPELMGKLITGITTDDVLRIKNRAGKHKIVTNRAIQLLKRMFNWSSDKVDGKINFWKLPENPAVGVKPYPEKAKQRILQPHEIGPFNAALEKLLVTHVDLHDYIVITLASGARRGDVLSMRWSDVDLASEMWDLPHSKGGTTQTIALIPESLSVLERRHQARSENAVWVFPSDSKLGHILDFKRSWDEFRKAAGVPDLRQHDLRHTAASYMIMSGASLAEVGLALGHKSLRSTQRYAHLAKGSEREARMGGVRKMFELMKNHEARTKKKAKRLPG
jgi:integrase